MSYTTTTELYAINFQGRGDNIVHPLDSIYELRDGDRFFVTADAFLPKEIVKEMEFFNNKHGISLPFKPYSHAGTLAWIKGDLYVFESIANGFNPTLFVEEYDLRKDHCMIIRNLKPYSDYERYRIVKRCLKMVKINTFYQYWALVAWKIYNHTNIDLFGKGGGDTRNVCYESTWSIHNWNRPHEFPQSKFVKASRGREIVPFHVLLGNYEIIYQHNVPELC